MKTKERSPEECMPIQYHGQRHLQVEQKTIEQENKRL
jgi:hypothetical protein